MAINNEINNIFPDGLTTAGTTNINVTGAGTTTIGSSSSGAVNFAGGSFTLTLNNAAFTLTTGTGNISIGTDATNKTINVGTSGDGTVFCKTAGFELDTNGNPFLNKTGTGNLSISNSGGDILIDASSGITIGNTQPAAINISTAANNIPIIIGSTASTSTLNINSGTAGITVGTTGAKTINIGNTTGATSVSLVSDTNVSNPNFSYYPTVNITGNSATLINGLIHTVTATSSLTTLTLPTTATVGSFIIVAGYGTGGWSIAQNSGQTINSTATSTTTGTGGSLASGGRYDCVTLVCTVANTNWSISGFKGTLTFV